MVVRGTLDGYQGNQLENPEGFYQVATDYNRPQIVQVLTAMYQAARTPQQLVQRSSGLAYGHYICS